MILLPVGGTDIIQVPVIRITRGALSKSMSGTGPNGRLTESSSTNAGNTTALTGGVTIIQGPGSITVLTGEIPIIQGHGWSADFPMATGPYGLEEVRTLFTTVYITGVLRPVMWL